MSNPPLSIHLFNCDRTYKLDAVEDWLNGTKRKLGFELSVEKHYFSLSEMSELSSKKIPSLQMDLAVFVVHAHESRLSINEDNAGIGYAKVYKALLQATGDNVIIVIGGDDNYKNQDEENTEFISRWAKRKVSSQFNGEFLDGRKSFIFSWNKKHREIHEEALVHFFDTSKKGQKFEYQLKPKLPPTPVTQHQTSATQPAIRKPGDTRTQPQSGTSDLLQYDNRSQERKTGDRSQSSSYGKVTGEIESSNIKPRQPSSAAEPTKSKPEETNPLQQPGTWNPQQRVELFEGKAEDRGVNAPFYTKKAKRSADLSVLGWEAKPESWSAVTQFIQRHRDILNLANDPDFLNITVEKIISYLEDNPLKYCALVVDAEKVESAQSDHQHEVDFLRLLQTAEKNVEEKIIVTVCCPLFMSMEDEFINQRIENAFNDSKKVYVAWFKNGKPALGENELILRLTAAIAGSGPSNYPQHQSNSAQYSQIPLSGMGQPYAQENVASASLQQFGNRSSFASGSQLAPPGPQGVTENPSSHLPTDSTEKQPSHLPTVSTENQPSHLPTDSCNYKVVLPPGKTVMLLTRLRNGIISNRKEDVQYQKPDFTVPDCMKSHLLHKHSKTSDAKLVILMNEKDEFVYQVNEKKDKADLSVLGWEVKPESWSAVTQFIQRHRDILNLATDSVFLNITVHEIISYLEDNPLKYCALVVDAEKVKTAQRDHQHEVDFLRLLQTAEKNVEEKIILTVCYPLYMSMEDQTFINQRIENAFNDSKKVYVAWFENGKPAPAEDEFIIRLTEAIVGSGSNYPQHQSNSTQYSQIPLSGTGQPYTQENVASGSLQKFYNQPSFASGSQFAPPGPQGITGNQSSHLPTDSTENQPFYLPTVSTENHPSFLPTDSTENQPSHLPTDSTKSQPSHLPTDSTGNQPSHLPTDSTENQPSHLPTDSTENQPSHLPTDSTENQRFYLPTDSTENQPSHLPTDSTKNQQFRLPTDSTENQPSYLPTDFTENQPSHLPTDSYKYKVVLPPGKTVMLMTRLREGRISYQKEDVEYHKPEFVVPDYMATDLLHKHSNTSDAKLVILMNERDQLVYRVGENIDKGWHQFIILALDDTIMLKTHLKSGQVSYEDKDLVIRYLNWRIPEDVETNLMQTFQPTPIAELFVFSDSQRNLTCIVQVGATRWKRRFIPVTCYRPVTNWVISQM